MAVQRLLAVLALLAGAGCAAPIGVTRVSARSVHRSLTANALSTGHASEWTRKTVSSWGLLGRFDGDPEGVLPALREVVTSGHGGSAEAVAPGELPLLHAGGTEKEP